MYHFSCPPISPYPDRLVQDVINLVAHERSEPRQLLMNRSRCQAKAAKARQLAMYLSHVVLGRSLSEIGGTFGRDRTTVSYACGVIEDMRDDPAFDAEVSRLENRLVSSGLEIADVAA